jgi:hypothetical protein
VVGDAPPEEPIGYLVGMTILAFLFALMLPTMMFMYIDMRTLRLENERLTSKIGKYTSVFERCDK